MHRPPEGQGRNGVTRAQLRTSGWGGGGGYGLVPSAIEVDDMAKISYHDLFYF